MSTVAGSKAMVAGDDLTAANVPVELRLGRAAPDAEVDVLFVDPDGVERAVPAFVGGDGEWGVRYASPASGDHAWRLPADNPAGLAATAGVLRVTPYTGDHPLYRHGPLRASDNRQYLQHHDGTPFCWLGDTWWLALADRLAPQAFQAGVADRVAKGFNLIQLVAGLYPDQDLFDPRTTTSVGHAWEPGLARPNARWFDHVDAKVAALVDAGLTPCLLACWGFHLLKLGPDRMRRHWRTMIARWGAWPVVWCLAGEASVAWYLTADQEGDSRRQREGWTDLARYVRRTDPFGRLLTLHPYNRSAEDVTDPAVLDADLLQTGHGGYLALPGTIRTVRRAIAAQPRLPVIQAEVCYEGNGGYSWADVQRLMFWANWLCGARGFTYGADGVWQANQPEAQFGASPSGMAWGNTLWDDGLRAAGSTDLGHCQRLLERFAWWRFEERPDWVTPHASAADEGPLEDFLRPICAGIPGEVRLVWLPANHARRAPLLRGLEPGVPYRAYLYDPRTGHDHPLPEVRGDAAGDARPDYQRPPIFQDWVLVLEQRG